MSTQAIVEQNADIKAARSAEEPPQAAEGLTELTDKNEQTLEKPSTADIATTVSRTSPAYVQGWRLYVLTAGIWISLFLSTLETTIVSTSLVSITDALDGFNERDWIVTSYLITYTGFMVIFAKLGDIFGKKTMLLLGIFIFTVFSTVCGASTSIIELIIFRAFQGIGASGIYSMIMAISPSLVPQEKYGKYIGIVSSVFAIASVLGPVLGGAISTHSTWRWVFLLNTPAGVLAFVLVAISLPSSLASESSLSTHFRAKFSRETIRRVDLLGMLLLLFGSILLVFALEESGSAYPWGSPIIISTLVCGCCCLICFINWEFYVGKTSVSAEPVFPLSILKDRVLVGMMLTAFFIGYPFVAVVVNIPQRAQAVDGLSPVKAGIALLPLLLISPLATLVSGVATSTLKVPPAYLIVLGAALQLVGMGLISSLPTSNVHISSQQYGEEVLMGFGFGFGLATVLSLAPLVVKEKDLPVTMGALTQVRVLGGTIGLAICSTILNNHVQSNLSGVLSSSQLAGISNSLSTIDTLTPDQQKFVRETFAEGYNKQMQIMAIFSGVAFITSLLVLEKNPRRVG